MKTKTETNEYLMREVQAIISVMGDTDIKITHTVKLDLFPDLTLGQCADLAFQQSSTAFVLAYGPIAALIDPSTEECDRPWISVDLSYSALPHDGDMIISNLSVSAGELVDPSDMAGTVMGLCKKARASFLTHFTT